MPQLKNGPADLNRLLHTVYQEELRKGKSKQIASMAAWGAAKNAGWSKGKDGKWAKK